MYALFTRYFIVIVMCSKPISNQCYNDEDNSIEYFSDMPSTNNFASYFNDSLTSPLDYSHASSTKSLIKTRRTIGWDGTLIDDTDNVGTDRAPFNFGFVAFLYNSKKPDRICVGVIISQWWVVDHCDDFPGYKYDYFNVGSAVNISNQCIKSYKIKETVRHNGYKRMDFKTQKFDARLMFAAQDALFLHRSSEKIKLIPGVVSTIRVNQKNAPHSGYGVYLNNGIVHKKRMHIIDRRNCNDYFKELQFVDNKPVSLQDSHFCVSPDGINYKECCKSQSVFVADNILVGIMSWSTGCFEESKIDPWVLSNITHYSDWIRERVDDLII